MPSLNEQRMTKRQHCIDLALQIYDRYLPEAKRGMLASFAGSIASRLTIHQLADWEKLLEDNVKNGDERPAP